MAKPVNRKIWLFNCPECGNNKLFYASYKNVVKYKCSKCDYKWEMSHELIQKGEKYKKSEDLPRHIGIFPKEFLDSAVVCG